MEHLIANAIMNVIYVIKGVVYERAIKMGKT